jgi:glycerol uptake facilitator-like aquaporin
LQKLRVALTLFLFFKEFIIATSGKESQKLIFKFRNICKSQSLTNFYLNEVIINYLVLCIMLDKSAGKKMKKSYSFSLEVKFQICFLFLLLFSDRSTGVNEDCSILKKSLRR